MNGLMVVGFAIVFFATAYLVYGRWLVNTWGIDVDAKTPAHEFEDGKDYSPASRFTVFANQFSSITGAGPVTGPIIAAMFGWLPALLWLLVGGVFFGAVQDFTALYASVKNKGKSMGMLIEQYVGKTGRRLFLLFCWLFTLLVIAAFADIVANTFNGFAKDGSLAVPNASAASISMLYIFVAMGFGFFIRKFQPKEGVKLAVGFVLFLAMMTAGIAFPMYFDATVWRYVVFGYCFIASVLPMWLLMQPRDYLSSFLLLGMLAGAVIGVLVANPTINMPAFVGFEVKGLSLFPILFITIACGAVSGFHSLVSSGTSSKTIDNEKDMLTVGYGSMLIESLLGVVALVIVCSAATGGVLPQGTPFQIFANAVGGFFMMFGLPQHVAVCFMTMCVSALAMTTIDSVARIGRMSLQELLASDEGEEQGAVAKFLSNTYVATVVTLVLAYLLCLAGYMNIWPLFGAANQLLSALVLIALSVFLRTTGRKGWMLYVPMTFMFLVTMSALVLSVMGIYTKLGTGDFVFMVDGLQLILALALMTLAVMVVKHCGKELISGRVEDDEEESKEPVAGM
ncbi:MAG: carbon starvation protein A [Anaerovibrio sp.]|uniref:carbon starvation CstA family protein n=1 Tax=Anaerovibrio sp. TaxID=1872532 RepID=UPI001AFDC91B|nr:carbon starvation protein A [Anaerovibrio sp.]MBO6245508.1 carbon starvation protein A [Anaerovibrio sp.]